MTNEKIWEIALAQSAVDCNCKPEDFLKTENVMTISAAHPKARKYLPLPFACDMVSYGSNIVTQTSPEVAAAAGEYLRNVDAAHAFETPNVHILDELLRPHGLRTCFMAEYFLPDVDALKPLECGYELRMLHQEDFQDLYRPEWSDALCEQRKELDVLGVGAYDGGKLVGLAACSADCEEMYQIGVNVLPEYRRQGIAAALTSRLALEILALGKVPFYCAAWCNLKSVRNAIKCGFRPAWAELTARDIAFVDKMNGKGNDMELICKLDDRMLLGQPGWSEKEPRVGVRGIVRNCDGQFAVMYSEKFDLYSLPGGGVEPGEDELTALRREILEETGCGCDEIRELGEVYENRGCHDFTQRNLYYMVTTAQRRGQLHLTEKEMAVGTKVLWVSFEEAIRLISTPKHTTEQRKYIQARDTAALQAYSGCGIHTNEI